MLSEQAETVHLPLLMRTGAFTLWRRRYRVLCTICVLLEFDSVLQTTNRKSYQALALEKLLTPMCLCHQAVDWYRQNVGHKQTQHAVH